MYVNAGYIKMCNRFLLNRFLGPYAYPNLRRISTDINNNSYLL
jgi:hypothetical protein